MRRCWCKDRDGLEVYKPVPGDLDEIGQTLTYELRL
jgi:hypothetical protein